MKKIDSTLILKAIITLCSIISFLAGFVANAQSMGIVVPYEDEKIYLHFDKPLYESGDVVWFKVYLRDGNTLRPSTKSEMVYAELIGPDGKTDKKIKLLARNGKCHGDFFLKSDLPGGLYKIRAYTNWMKNYGEQTYFEKEITVQKVLYPKLLMTLEFEKKAYGPGDHVIAFFKLEKTDKTALENIPANWKLSIEGNEFKKSSVNTNAQGKANIEFDLPAKLRSEDALINVMVNYDGYTESISRSVPVIMDNISLHFFPEGGDAVQNIEGKVAFKALNRYGKAADVSGEIIDEEGNLVTTFKSYHEGMGTFNITYKDKKKYFAKILRPEGINDKFELPSSQKNGFSMSLLSQTKNQIEFQIYNPSNEMPMVIVRAKDEIVYSSPLSIKKGNSTVKIPVTAFPVGIMQVTLFDHLKNPQCERLVFVNKHKQLKVEVTPNKEKYLPREEIELQVKVSDENNKPVDASLSVAVVDDKVISFANDKQDNILSYFLMSSDLQGKVENPNFYFKKNEIKADSALDFVMMTHGWRRFSWQEIKDGSALKAVTAFTCIPEKTSIKGIAALNTSNHRLAGTKVKIRNSKDSVYTDKDGRFEFKNSDPYTTHMLELKSKEGYKRYLRVQNYTGDYVIEKELNGKVLDKTNGLPIKGVHVFYKGTEIGTYTDSLGLFNFKIMPESNPVLVAFHKTYNINITGVSSEKEMQLAMLPLEKNKENNSFEKLKNNSGYNYKDLTDRSNIVPFDGHLDAQLHKMSADAMRSSIKEIDQIYSHDYFHNNKVTYVDEYPKFPGGEKALEEFIYKNLNYPEKALNYNHQGELTVGFWVSKTGKLEKVNIQSGKNYYLNDEAIRLVKSLPDWIPAKSGDETVDYPASVKVKFTLDKDNKGQPFKIYISETNPGQERISFSKGRDFYWPVYNEEKYAYSRNDFRKTIYWNPKLETGKDGEAICKFYNSDEVTRFRIITEGMDAAGNIGRQENTYITQLPFSVEARIPNFLSYGDKPKIPVTITNNTDQKIEVKGSFNVPGSIASSHAIHNNWNYSLEANSKKTVDFEFTVGRQQTKDAISISASSNYLSDRITQTVEVFSNGFPMSKSFSGDSLKNISSINISDPVKGTVRANFTAYPGMLSQLMEGVESILQEPHGCFEQTSSTTYPNILALQLMKENGTADGDITKKANAMIEKGYKMLIGFETKENGYEWFGKAPYHPALTAYGLLEFNDMKKVYASVDNNMMLRTEKRILADVDLNGGFKRDGNRTQFGRTSDDNVWNSYIVYALSQSGVAGINDQINSAYKKAMEGNDTYVRAVLANSMFKTNNLKEAQLLMDLIKSQVKKNGFGNLPAKQSITGSGGISLQVETASFILLALLNEKEKDTKIINEALLFLVKSRQGGGGFGSTQATVMALKALTEYSKSNINKKSEGEVEISINGKYAADGQYFSNSIQPLKITGFDELLDSGAYKIAVNYLNTKDPIPFELNIKWFSNTPASSPECKVEISTSLPGVVKQGETARLNINVKNKTFEGLPNTMVKIGIPSGLSVQPWQLKELSDKNVFDYYEIKGNYIYFYYTGMNPSEEKNISLDLKAEIKGEYHGSANCAYLYYTSEFKNWNPGLKVVVN